VKVLSICLQWVRCREGRPLDDGPEAYEPHAAMGGGASDAWRSMQLGDFFWEREAHYSSGRGFKVDECGSLPT